MSQKFQITLPDDLASELTQEAARQGLPLAEFIRQTIREKLRQSRSPSRGKKPPLAAIVGIVNSDETDLAARVDKILYRLRRLLRRLPSAPLHLAAQHFKEA